MNTTSWGKVAAHTALLVVLHGCGGDGAGSAGPVPDGLTVRIGETEVESGSLAVDFQDVPVHSIFWPQQLGSGVQNVVGSAQVNIVSISPSGTVGTPVSYPVVEGDGAEAFQLVTDDAFASQFLVYVQCVPPGPGVYEATLVSGLMGVSGSHHTRMRCSTADGYAMIEGQTMPGGGDADELLMVGGKRVHRRTFEITEPRNYPDFGAWEYFVGPVTTDGTKLPFISSGPSAYVTPAADYRYYTYDLQSGQIAAALTPEEVTASVGTNAGVPKLNGDGTQLFYADQNGIHRKVLGGALTNFVPAPPPQGTLGTYHVLNVSGDGSEVLYSFANMISAVAFDAVWMLDTATGESVPFGFVDAAGATIANSPTWVTELVFTPDMRYALAGQYNQGSVGIWLYDREAHTLKPLFERAKRHVTTLPGMPGTILLAGGLSLTPDAKLASVLFNLYTSAEYWAGPKSVYVTETETDATYSYGVLPDGKPISGDGWNYMSSGVTSDGAMAHASVFWSGGVSGDGFGPFTLFVPRERWLEIPE